DFQGKKYAAALDGQKHLSEAQLEDVITRLINKEKGLIVCGPQPDYIAFPKAVIDLARKLNIPIFADPLSQLRSGKHGKENIIDTYDAILKNEEVRKRYRPDFIIRFGAMPVSKPYLFFIKENKNVPQFIVENHSGYREPTGNVTASIFANPVLFCE